MAKLNENEDSDISRSLGRVESSIQSLRDLVVAHDSVLKELKDVTLKQNERIIKVEAAVDSVEGHGAAISDFEERLNNFESLRKLEIARHDRDRMWIKWILWLVTALVGDHFTGSKISEFMGHLIK